MGEGRAFLAIQIGDKGSPERRRADDVTQFVVRPVLDQLGLELDRADLDPTPGRITPKMLRSLLEADLVIADVTGRNANVYYEVAVAHAFSRPVVMMVDDAKNVAFDTKDERLIELGEYEGTLGVRQAEAAKVSLREAIEAVLADGFVPSSLVAEVAAARSIDQLAPENPVASELASMREVLEEVRAGIRPKRVVPKSIRDELNALKQFVEWLAAQEMVSSDDLENLITMETPADYDEWVHELQGDLQEQEARYKPAREAPPPPDMDDVPF